MSSVAHSSEARFPVVENAPQHGLDQMGLGDHIAPILPGTRPGTILLPLESSPNQRYAPPGLPQSHHQPRTDYGRNNVALPSSRISNPQTRASTQQQQYLTPQTTGYQVQEYPDYMHHASNRLPHYPAEALSDQPRFITPPPASRRPRIIRLPPNGENDVPPHSQQTHPSLPSPAKIDRVVESQPQAQPTRPRQQLYLPTPNDWRAPAIAGKDFSSQGDFQSRPLSRLPVQAEASVPSHPPETRLHPQPSARLVRLGPAENGGSNLPTHMHWSQMPPTTNMPVSTPPRQVLLRQTASSEQGQGRGQPSVPHPPQV